MTINLHKSNTSIYYVTFDWFLVLQKSWHFKAELPVLSITLNTFTSDTDAGMDNPSKKLDWNQESNGYIKHINSSLKKKHELYQSQIKQSK